MPMLRHPRWQHRVQVLSVEDMLPSLQALPTIAHVEHAIASLLVAGNSKVRHRASRDACRCRVPRCHVLLALHKARARLQPHADYDAWAVGDMSSFLVC